MVLAGLIGGLRITGKKLSENTYLFVGAGQVSGSLLICPLGLYRFACIQAACGIADLVTHAMVREGSSLEEARSKIWMYDVHGLIVEVRSLN